MYRALIKVAAIAAILVTEGVCFAPDALAWRRFNDGQVAKGNSSASELDDRGRRVFYDQRGRRIVKPATVCRCMELDCCDR